MKNNIKDVNNFKQQIQIEILKKIYKTKQNTIENNLLILLSMITSTNFKKYDINKYIYTNSNENILKIYCDILKELLNIQDKVISKNIKNTFLNEYSITISKLEILKIVEIIIKLDIVDINSYIQGVLLNDFKISDPKQEYKASFKYSLNILENCISIDAIEILKNNIFKKISEQYSFKESNVKENDEQKIYTYILSTGENIYMLLANLGITKKLLEFEEIRIAKEINGNINRSVNFEVANLAKKMKTSTYQLKVIDYLEENNLINRLSEKQKEFVKVRKQNVDASFKEIADILKISKTSATNRFKLIEDIYIEHRNKIDSESSK